MKRRLGVVLERSLAGVLVVFAGVYTAFVTFELFAPSACCCPSETGSPACALWPPPPLQHTNA